MTIEMKGDHESVHLKYRQLCRELNEMRKGKESWGNIDHTISKLGIFITDLQDDYIRLRRKVGMSEVKP